MDRIVVCASGEGTGFEALVQASRRAELQAEIAGLIVNRAEVGAVARAERLGVPYKVLSLKDFPDRATRDAAMAAQLQDWKAHWVALAGFLALVGPQVLRHFPQRIVNSHPALLPKFGGPGMYGRNVHAAVIAAGENETGVTIHLVDAEYDRGRILAQDRIAVEKGDTAATLEARVKAREVLFYPRVLNDLVTGRITSG